MRKGKQHLLALLVAALATGAYLVFRPVCAAIDAETLAVFNPPIETRRETTSTARRSSGRRTASGSSARPGSPASSSSRAPVRSLKPSLQTGLCR